MSPSVKLMKERINNQKRKSNVKKDTHIVPVELYEGVEALVRTNGRKVFKDELKAYLNDIFNNINEYNPVKGSIIKLSTFCDFDYDLLYEDSIMLTRENSLIEEKIFALV